MDDQLRRAEVEAAWRIESARLIAGIARVVRDVGIAEELAQDALVAALEQWPASGIPRNAGAWLLSVGKRRAIDYLRRNKRLEYNDAALDRDREGEQNSTEEVLITGLDDEIGDDLLRLIFVTCHPILPPQGRVALTLRVIGGLTADEIGRAFLTSEATIAQRIVRAKRTLAEERIPFAVPRGSELQERLASVLEVIYLIFTEGYAATAGDDWLRPELCQDALRLGRILAELAPGEAEVHGLVALMEIQASRSKARVTRCGEPVLLLEQDRSRWDRLLINRGLAALDRAQRLNSPPGSYQLQAKIAACHARARTAGETDWVRISSLYADLAAIAPSPVVELNRAMAVAMAYGPAAGLALADALISHPALANYHRLPSVRGDLLFKLNRREEARAEFLRAADLARNAQERRMLLARASDCDS